MKKAGIAIVLVVCLCGCDAFRPAATEAQKQNAWAHWQTCGLTQRTATDEQVSETLTYLTALATEQSEAFVLDYGLPDERPSMQAAASLAQQAKADAQRRPNAWTLADAAMELGIGLAGLLGGAAGLRMARFFKQAKQKSDALKEIIDGNELFKQLCPTAANDFKQAQSNQSTATRVLVTEAKANA